MKTLSQTGSRVKQDQAVFRSSRVPPRPLSVKMAAVPVDKSVNPLVASVKPSKTMALTDLATQMKEQGIDVS